MKHGYFAALAFVFTGVALGAYALFGREPEQNPGRPTYKTDPNAALRERCSPYAGTMGEQQAYHCAIAVWDRVHYTALKTGSDLSTDRAMKRECFYHFTLPSYATATEGARDLFNRSGACLREVARLASESSDTSQKANDTRLMISETQRDIAGHLALVPGKYR